MLNEFVSGGWKPQDLRNSRGWRLAVNGKPIVFESDCSSAEERRKLPIYAELFSRHQLEIFAGVTLRVDAEPWTFNLVRSEQMGGFELGDAAPLLKVRPSMQRLLRVAGHMSKAAAQSTISAFEQADMAAVLVDGDARVLGVNGIAGRLMGDGIDVHHRRLVAHGASANTALQALIHTALQGQAASAGPVFIRRASRHPLIVEAVEMKGVRAEIFGFSGALLTITDPEARPRPRLEILQKAFGLTAREAKVARLLASGMDAAEIGEILGLRLSSTQQLVKTVLAKTDTRRQGALVALLSRLPGGEG